MPSPLSQLLTSRKTILGAIAILGTIALVGVGLWRQLPQAYVLAMVGGLVAPIVSIINALGQEDAAKAQPPPVLSPAHVDAIAQQVVASVAPPITKLVSSIPPSSHLPQIDEPKDSRP